MNILERFHSRYIPEPNSGCWIWTGATAREYGRIWIGDRVVYAHRASFVLHGGELIEGYDVCHKCDVKSCVNPEHLFQGTRQENIQDCINKGRAHEGRHNSIKDCCPNGHLYSGANLYLRPDGGRGCRKCRRDASNKSARARRSA